MRIFKLEPLYDKDGDTVFKSLVPSGYKNFFDESAADIAKGLPIRMKWCYGDEGKAESNFIVTPIAALAFTDGLAKKISQFAPSAQLIGISLYGAGCYAMLRVSDFKPGSVNIDHIFWMFNKHKRHLCTEKFKHWWESNGYTGMVFSEVDEMEDSLFKTV